MTYKYGALRDKMKEQNVTQASLADKAAMKHTTLNLSLNNKRSFRQDEMVNICKALGIPFAEIDAYFFNN